MPAFKTQKLRTNLKLVVHRLKLLEKKKTEQAMKARREIADYIKNKRFERARIRVEHIVREDYFVEAMEVAELYCDLLLARMGMLEQMMYCEESIAEAVATLIWVTPRLSAEVPEFREISHQLEIKFGKQFAQQARSNLSGTVNPKVIHRLGVEAPKKSLVESYLIEIARNYHIEYEPDPSMFLEDDGVPPAAMGEKPFLPNDEPPLPQKEDPDHDRYVPLPGAPPPQAQFHPPPPAQFPPQPQPRPGPPPSQPPGYGAQPPPYPSHVQPPPPNPNLPYPTGPQSGVQPPPIPMEPPNLDLPPVPNTSFPDQSTGSADGGDLDFDDLTRRFEQLKKKK